MKIKTVNMDIEEVLAQPVQQHVYPKRPNIFFRMLLRAVSAPDLKVTNFKYREFEMEKLGKKEPCLVLMNHSSFIDLKIASTVLYPRPLNIVCTSDGFVGKERLMRSLGCIPTRKFVTDTQLVRDMMFALKKLKSSILMYPEASYTFDGTATPLPAGLGKCIKLMGVPVVMIRTYGAFARDPLYNGLRLRKVDVSADISYILSPEDIRTKTAEDINGILYEQFSFDNFKWQQENNVKISEPFRAEGLNRVLYKCPHCGAEGSMESGGADILCNACGKGYTLTEYGFMEAKEGKTEFPHIPDWYAWERDCVRQEFLKGSYKLDVPVDIYMMVNTRKVYGIGEGRLTHGENGFRLTGCNGKLDYHQHPLASYSLYSDYFWYEMGDVICIGDAAALYYCFPKGCGDIVAKTRLATEELYKIKKAAQ